MCSQAGTGWRTTGSAGRAARRAARWSGTATRRPGRNPGQRRQRDASTAATRRAAAACAVATTSDDALHRGDDLAREPRRQRRRQPRQRPRAADERVAHAPIASTHEPSGRARSTLSTRIRNASTSMSNRAPERARRCRCGGRPSRPRRPAPAPPRRAATSTDGRHGPARTSPPPARSPRRPGVARASVTRLAGPSAAPGRCSRRQRSTRHEREAMPASQPAGVSPTVDRRAPASSDDLGRQTRPPVRGTSCRTAQAPCLRRVWVAAVWCTRARRRVRFSGRKEDARDGRRARVLAARPRRGRDPHGSRCPTRARTRCWCARCTRGVSRGTETLVFRGGVPPSQHAAMRAPFQEGDFPAPVKYGYLNVGVVEAGPGRAASAGPSSASTRTRPRTSSRPSAVTAGAGRRAGRRGPCWPARWRPRSTRCGTPRRWSATGSPWSGAGMVGCCVAALLARFPASACSWSTPTRRVPAVAAALGVDFALPADAARRLRPGRARQRHRRRARRARWSCSPPRAPWSS